MSGSLMPLFYCKTAVERAIYPVAIHPNEHGPTINTTPGIINVTFI